MKLGQEEFRECEDFVSNLPNIRNVIEDDELEIGVKFADLIFWKFKSLLAEVIW